MRRPQSAIGRLINLFRAEPAAVAKGRPIVVAAGGFEWLKALDPHGKDGMQQAPDHVRTLDNPFVVTSNGHALAR